MTFIATFFNHAEAVRSAAAALGAQAEVQLADFSLRLRLDGEPACWPPKFVASLDQRLMYTGAWSRHVIGFAGWLPYALRQWPIAVDKVAFKRHAVAAGIRTPLACFDPARIGGPFLIKQADSSFGEGIRGPFPAFDAADAAQRLDGNEYYENFIVGVSLKAWCWDGQCVAVHLEKPTVVQGDGRHSLGELVAQLPNSRGGHDWPLVERLARCCGMDSLDAVVPEGREVLVEYRHGSRYRPPTRANPNVWPQIRDGDLGRQLQECSAQLAQAIPGDPALYTLDGVIDEQGRVWLLEMNCNPLVHPDAYGAILRSPQAERKKARQSPAFIA